MHGGVTAAALAASPSVSRVQDGGDRASVAAAAAQTYLDGD